MKPWIFVLLLLIVAGCASSETNTETSNKEAVQTPPPTEIIEEGVEEMAGNPIAVIVTNKGEFRFELYEEGGHVPQTVANFIELAESGFYDGLTFHRYEPGFVIQGGDPKGDGTGGSDKTIPLETDPSLKHVKGALGMARSQDPNSASSQFYVAVEASHFLDGNYAVFGIVTEGMDAVMELRAGDVMEKVTIER